METLISFLKRPFIKRLLVLVVIGFLLYLIRNQITLFLVTFILIYLIDTSQKFITKKISRLIRLPRIIVVIFLYLLFLGFLFLVFYKFVPEIIREITSIVESVIGYFTGYNFSAKTESVILNYIYGYLSQIDFKQYIQQGGTVLLGVISNIGSASISVLLAIILSFFFMLEKDKIVRFYHGFKDSKLSWLYNELNYFGEKFANSFGKVIQTQILISFINSVLSVVVLAILGFPNLIGLGIMIFVLGLVPIAGVIISCIPLSIIAYSIGGVQYILIVIVLGTVLHALEAYVLNPKIMSQKTKLPVFITFLVLIMSEHLFGAWGLIVGIPITVFLLDVLEVKTEK